MSAPMDTVIVRKLKPLLHGMEAKGPYNLQNIRRASEHGPYRALLTVRGY